MSENVAASASPAAKDQIYGRIQHTKLSRPFRAFDLATALLIIAITSIALWTFRDYAVSNDEGLQHHYGQLILEYYRSGMTDDGIRVSRPLSLRWPVRYRWRAPGRDFSRLRCL